tara:strand:- start:38 stop:451 length:414 start_codon:yes stop_codon:yes gene_type:complete
LGLINLIKIGNRNFQVKSSDFWITMPSGLLTLNLWTESPKTYLLAEPIFVQNPQELIDKFILKFGDRKVNVKDSTLLENREELNLQELFVKFNSEKITEINEVKIRRKLILGKDITSVVKIEFKGFEIWKNDNLELK